MKRLCLVAAMLLSVVSMHAQFRWGVEAGANFNSLSFSSEMFKSGNRAGFFIGPKVDVKIPLLGFGADASLLYSLNSVNVQAAGVDKSKSLSYLEIPMNVRYTFSFKVISLYLATGPQFNYCMSTDETIASLYGAAEGGINRSTWGWNVGAGVEILKHLQVGVTYTIPISDNGNLEFSDVSNVFSNYKQKTVKLRLAYMF